MRILIMICGALYIGLGILSIGKKALWVHQGIAFSDRRMDTVPYCWFMGITDIIMGSLFLVSAITFEYIDYFIIIIFIIYIILSIYANCKYRIKDETRKGDE